MNTEALFLFLILLLGLVLCSFLGGNCNKEGLTNNNTVYNGPNGATATMSTNSSGTPIITLNQTSGSSNVIFTQSSSNSNLYTNPFGFTATLSNGNLVIATPDNGPTQTFTPSSSSSSSTSTQSTLSSLMSSFSSPSSGSYDDNYNHYSGTGSTAQLQNGMVFTDSSGDTVTVITNSNGTQSLQMLQAGQTTPMVLSSTPPASSSVTATANTFYAPFGGITATVITGSDGQTAIQFNLPNGQIVIFTQSGSSSNQLNPSLTSTQYYGSTGYPVQQSGYSLAYNGPYGGSAGAVTGPYGNTAYYAQGPYGNTAYGINPYYNNGPSSNQYYGPYGGSAGAVTGPNGNTAYYAQGPNGNTVYGTNTNNNSSNGYGNTYSSTMSSGIPASQIPPGQEDLYILKSEIVPPVCPACPASASCPRQEKCPPCPACARCPEPSFECKKVPNYDAISDDYLPQPVLSDFSQFGM